MGKHDLFSLDASRPWPRRRIILLALLCAGALVCCRALPQANESIHLVVLHTNDVHGQALARRATWIEDREVWVGGLERVAAYVASVRAETSGPNEAVLVLDAGDWFQGTPEGRLRGGRDFVNALTLIPYDAMALGNHEFDLGLESLLSLLLECGPPVVCANLRQGLERVGWVPAYRILERRGLEIAIVGLISPDTPGITHPDAKRLTFADPLEELDRVISELPTSVDLVIPLTHDGVELDRKLAQHRPELPLIVGGHSHTYLREGLMVGTTRIAQAGDKATVVGRVDLELDPLTGRVLSSSSRLVDLDQPVDPAFRDAKLADAVERMRGQTEREMAVLVGHLAAAPKPAGPLASGGLGSWICDAMRGSTGADIALHNRGGIRSTLAPGPISRRQLFEVCPFQNTVVTIELTGAELLECLRAGLEGKASVRIEVSGLDLDLRLDAERRIRLDSVRVGGTPLDVAQRYRVATNSFLARGGDGIFLLDRTLEIADTGVQLCDLLERQFSVDEPLLLPEDDRIHVH